jgi:hypothetical protein
MESQKKLDCWKLEDKTFVIMYKTIIPVKLINLNEIK